MTQVEWQNRLSKLGMMRPVSGGIQLDITAVLDQRNQDRLHGNLCDHNCTAETGKYTCPAAFTLNQGLDSKSLAPADVLLKGLQIAIPAVKAANVLFLDKEFEDYCKKFQVPPEVAAALDAAIRDNPIEINITGGNPELHPDILEILTRLKKRGDVVINLTTTGRKLMLEEDFGKEILKNPPEVLALSADSFNDAEQVSKLANKSSDELFSLWQNLSKIQGQQQKAIEALYTARKLKGICPPHTGFNLVVHPGNIVQIDGIIDALANNFPGFHIFPYPAQTGYLNKSGIFYDLAPLEKFTDQMIDAHSQDKMSTIPRLQYWLILKSIFNVFKGDSELIVDLIGGRGLWHCYKKSGAIRYIQIGKGSSPTNNIWGGGHLGCYWNTSTITYEDKQVWDMNVQSTVDYINKGAQMLARQSSAPCPGCGFPRLLFDVVSTEIGLNELLIQDYLTLRKQYAGY